METVLSLIGGAIIGWVTSWSFYRRSQRESEQQYQQVVQSLNALTSAVERAGGTIVRDQVTKLPTDIITGTWQGTLSPPTGQMTGDVYSPEIRLHQDQAGASEV